MSAKDNENSIDVEQLRNFLKDIWYNLDGKSSSQADALDRLSHILYKASLLNSTVYNIENILNKVISKIRTILYSDSVSIPWILEWDNKLSFILVYIIIPAINNEQSMKRIVFDMIKNDLDKFISRHHKIISENASNSSTSEIFRTYEIYCNIISTISSESISESCIFIDMLANHKYLSYIFLAARPRYDSLMFYYIFETSTPRLEVIKAFITYGYDFNKYPESYESILHTAVRLFRCDLVSFIAKQYMNLLTVREHRFGLTPLQLLFHSLSISKYPSLVSVKQLNQLVIDLIGSHYHLICDSECMLHGDIIRDYKCCPLYLALTYTDESVALNVILIASESQNPNHVDIMIKCLESIAKHDRVNLLRCFMKYFKIPSEDYVQIIAICIQNRSAYCFEYLLSQSVQNPTIVSITPTIVHPIAHMALLSDFNRLQLNQSRISNVIIHKHKHGPKIKVPKDVLESGFACKLLLAYPTALFPSILTMPSDAWNINPSNKLSSEMNALDPYISDNVMVSVVRTVSSSVNVIQLACLLDHIEFLYFICHYCDKYGILKVSILFPELYAASSSRDPADSAGKSNESHEIPSISSILFCILGSSMRCMNFLIELFPHDLIRSIQYSDDMGWNMIHLSLLLSKFGSCSPYFDSRDRNRMTNTPQSLRAASELSRQYLHQYYDVSMISDDYLSLFDKIYSFYIPNCPMDREVVHSRRNIVPQTTPSNRQDNAASFIEDRLIELLHELCMRYHQWADVDINVSMIDRGSGIREIVDYLTNHHPFTCAVLKSNPSKIFGRLQGLYSSDRDVANSLSQQSIQSLEDECQEPLTIEDSLLRWESTVKDMRNHSKKWSDIESFIQSNSYKVNLRFFLKKYKPDQVWMRVIKAIMLLLYPSDYIAPATDKNIDQITYWWTELRRKLGYGVSMTSMASHQTQSKMDSFGSLLLSQRQYSRDRQPNVTDDMMDEIGAVLKSCFLSDFTKNKSWSNIPSIPIQYRHHRRIVQSLQFFYNCAELVMRERHLFSNAKKEWLRFEYLTTGNTKVSELSQRSSTSNQITLSQRILLNDRSSLASKSVAGQDPHLCKYTCRMYDLMVSYESWTELEELSKTLSIVYRPRDAAKDGSMDHSSMAEAKLNDSMTKRGNKHIDNATQSSRHPTLDDIFNQYVGLSANIPHQLEPLLNVIQAFVREGIYHGSLHLSKDHPLVRATKADIYNLQSQQRKSRQRHSQMLSNYEQMAIYIVGQSRKALKGNPSDGNSRILYPDSKVLIHLTTQSLWQASIEYLDYIGEYIDSQRNHNENDQDISRKSFQIDSFLAQCSALSYGMPSESTTSKYITQSYELKRHFFLNQDTHDNTGHSSNTMISSNNPINSSSSLPTSSGNQIQSYPSLLTNTRLSSVSSQSISNGALYLSYLSPVHLALYCDRIDFISKFYEIFPDSRIDSDIIRFSYDVGAYHMLLHLPCIQRFANSTLDIDSFNSKFTFSSKIHYPENETKTYWRMRYINVKGKEDSSIGERNPESAPSSDRDGFIRDSSVEIATQYNNIHQPCHRLRYLRDLSANDKEFSRYLSNLLDSISGSCDVMILAKHLLRVATSLIRNISEPSSQEPTQHYRPISEGFTVSIERSGHLKGLILSSDRSSVLLSNGSFIPLDLFLSDISYLFKAMPAPLHRRSLSISHSHDSLQISPFYRGIVSQNDQYDRLLQYMAQTSQSTSFHSSNIEQTMQSLKTGLCSYNLDKAKKSCNGLTLLDATGETPLALAVRQGNYLMTNVLLYDVIQVIGFIPSYSCNYQEIMRLCNPILDANDKDHRDCLNANDLFIKPLRMAVNNMNKNLYEISSAIDQSYMTNIRRCGLNDSQSQSADNRDSETLRANQLSQGRGINVSSQLDILKYSISMIEHIWKYFLSSDDHKDFLLLSNNLTMNDKVSNTLNISSPNNPSAGMINGSCMDSFIRARKILVLLGIPFSRFGNGSKDKSQSSPMKPSQHRPDSPNYQRSNRSIDFLALNPSSLIDQINNSTSGQLKLLIQGWYRLRLTAMNRSHQDKVKPSSRVQNKYLGSIDCHVHENYAMFHNIFTSSVVFAEGYIKGKGSEVYFNLWSIYELLEIETQIPYHLTNTINRSTGYISGISRNGIQSSEESIRKAFRTAFMIIEFARLILIARNMSITTSEYDIIVDKANVNASGYDIVSSRRPHPWDAMRFEYSRQLSRLNHAERFLSSFKYQSQQRVKASRSIKSESDNDSHQQPQTQEQAWLDGSRTLIRMNEHVLATSLSIFLLMSKHVSSRFHHLRRKLLDCLVEILANVNAIKSSEFTSRFCEGYETDTEISNQCLSMASNTDHDRVSDEYNIQIHELIHQLENITFQDIYSTIFNRQTRASSVEVDKYARWRHFFEIFHKLKDHVSSLTQSSDGSNQQGLWHFQPEEIVLIDKLLETKLKGQMGSHQAIPFHLYLTSIHEISTRELVEDSIRELEINRSVLSQEKIKHHMTVIANAKKNELREGYRICHILYDFIDSIAGAVKYSSIYNHDAYIVIEEANASHYQENILLSVLLKSFQDYYQHHINEAVHEDSETLSPCPIDKDARYLIQHMGSLMLQLGLSAMNSDEYGRCPIVIAAMMGYDDLLSNMMIMEGFERDLNLQPSCPSVNDVIDSVGRKYDQKLKKIENHLKKKKNFKYLIWHVLMAVDSRDNSKSKTQSSPEKSAFIKCVHILLDYGFPVQSPAGACWSCLDLAAWNHIPSVFDRLLGILIRQGEDMKDDAHLSIDSYYQRILPLIQTLQLTIMLGDISIESISTLLHHISHTLFNQFKLHRIEPLEIHVLPIPFVKASSSLHLDKLIRSDVKLSADFIASIIATEKSSSESISKEAMSRHCIDRLSRRLQDLQREISPRTWSKSIDQVNALSLDYPSMASSIVMDNPIQSHLSQMISNVNSLESNMNDAVGPSDKVLVLSSFELAILCRRGDIAELFLSYLQSQYLPIYSLIHSSLSHTPNGHEGSGNAYQSKRQFYDELYRPDDWLRVMYWSIVYRMSGVLRLILLHPIRNVQGDGSNQSISDSQISISRQNFPVANMLVDCLRARNIILYIHDPNINESYSLFDISLKYRALKCSDLMMISYNKLLRSINPDRHMKDNQESAAERSNEISNKEIVWDMNEISSMTCDQMLNAICFGIIAGPTAVAVIKQLLLNDNSLMQKLQDPLLLSFRRGDVEWTDSMSRYRPSNQYGETLLHIVSRRCDRELMSYLLFDLSLDPTMSDQLGYKPIHAAVSGQACVSQLFSQAKMFSRTIKALNYFKFMIRKYLLARNMQGRANIRNESLSPSPIR